LKAFNFIKVIRRCTVFANRRFCQIIASIAVKTVIRNATSIDNSVVGVTVGALSRRSACNAMRRTLIALLESIAVLVLVIIRRT
jgi:hypothetical protein